MKKPSFLIYILLSFININSKSDISKNEIFKKIKNSVVQIWSNCLEMDFLRPYKILKDEQFSGTGFFIDSDGHIITNFHVIKDAKSVFITVEKFGQKKLEASIIGIFPDLDIALLKLDDKEYTIKHRNIFAKNNFLTLGDSDLLYPSNTVIALGYPLGERTLKITVGEIAGLSYMFEKPFIHITAPINPGNSGGPLINKKGEIIGINTAIMANSQNIGYAIPINIVKNFLPQLKSKKIVHANFLGIVTNNANDTLCKLTNNPYPGGRFINNIIKNSKAEEIDLKIGDILYSIEIDNHTYIIDEYGDIKTKSVANQFIPYHQLILTTKPDQDIKIVVYRNGEKIEKIFNFKNNKNEPIRYIYPYFEPEEFDYEIIGGLVFMQFRANHLQFFENNLDLQYYYKYKKNKKMIIITDIIPGSIFYINNCLYPGDIIHYINNQKINTLEDLRKVILNLNKDENSILSIKTKTGKFTAENINKILENEENLSKKFNFPISNIVKQLINK